MSYTKSPGSRSRRSCGFFLLYEFYGEAQFFHNLCRVVIHILDAGAESWKEKQRASAMHMYRRE